MRGIASTCRERRSVRTFSFYRLFCVDMVLLPPGDVNDVAFGSDDGGAGSVAVRLRMSRRETRGRR
jgi:hypothetical protein